MGFVILGCTSLEESQSNQKRYRYAPKGTNMYQNPYNSVAIIQEYKVITITWAAFKNLNTPKSKWDN